VTDIGNEPDGVGLTFRCIPYREVDFTGGAPTTARPRSPAIRASSRA
jgi:hypothetical protein